MRQPRIWLIKESVFISAPMGMFPLLLMWFALHFGFILPLSRLDPRIWWFSNQVLALPRIGLALDLHNLFLKCFR